MLGSSSLGIVRVYSTVNGTDPTDSFVQLSPNLLASLQIWGFSFLNNLPIYQKAFGFAKRPHLSELMIWFSAQPIFYQFCQRTWILTAQINLGGLKKFAVQKSDLHFLKKTSFKCNQLRKVRQ